MTGAAGAARAGGAPGATGAGRFAPSPTGSLHLGNLRTAFLAWLFARSAGLRFLVRVEDLDTGRVRPHFEREQLEDLAALGLDWDGPVVRQSERLARYDEALAALDAQGLLYPCYCTRREIREAASAPHGAGAEATYPGTCRDLAPGERERLERGGRRPALRLRAGAERVAFTDRLLGPCEDVVDDLVLRRNDGEPAYNLAVVVDDAAQDVTQVVRGADLAETTPRQLLVGRLLGLSAPEYAHVPLVLGPDGARLAKRHGAVTLRERAARGEPPARVRGLLAESLGLAGPGEEPAADELLARFDPDQLPREPTLLDAG